MYDENHSSGFQQYRRDRENRSQGYRSGGTSADALFGQALGAILMNQYGRPAPRSRARAARAAGPAPSAGFLPANAYQRVFDAQLRQKRYPARTEARCVDRAAHFQGAFVRYPPGKFQFYAHHGIDDVTMSQRDAELRAQGYRLSWRGRIECDGEAYNQATWIRS